jgi:hypothetical protein
MSVRGTGDEANPAGRKPSDVVIISEDLDVIVVDVA